MFNNSYKRNDYLAIDWSVTDTREEAELESHEFILDLNDKTYRWNNRKSPERLVYLYLNSNSYIEEYIDNIAIEDLIGDDGISMLIDCINNNISVTSQKIGLPLEHGNLLMVLNVVFTRYKDYWGGGHEWEDEISVVGILNYNLKIETINAI